MKNSLFIALLTLLAMSQPLYAAAQVDQEDVLMLEAAAKSMKRDYRAAEDLYTRVITKNNNPLLDLVKLLIVLIAIFARYL